MADIIVVYWRDIPAQVIAQRGRKRERRELGERFIQAIDRAAMKAGVADSDAYLEAWRKGPPEPCGDDLVAEADKAAAEIEKRYDLEALKILIEQNGWEPPQA
jgi:hypothetical protein